ncbi:MAG: hypothetical protein WCT20_00505 [Candidatus Babeliales bacterium]|jgi:hypothetical protein
MKKLLFVVLAALSVNIYQPSLSAFTPSVNQARAVPFITTAAAVPVLFGIYRYQKSQAEKNAALNNETNPNDTATTDELKSFVSWCKANPKTVAGVFMLALAGGLYGYVKLMPGATDKDYAMKWKSLASPYAPNDFTDKVNSKCINQAAKEFDHYVAWNNCHDAICRETFFKVPSQFFTLLLQNL